MNLLCTKKAVTHQGPRENGSLTWLKSIQMDRLYGRQFMEKAIKGTMRQNFWIPLLTEASYFSMTPIQLQYQPKSQTISDS